MKIRPIICVQSQGSTSTDESPLSGYGIANFSKIKDIRDLGGSVAPPYLILGITPDSTGENILKIDAVYNDGNGDIVANMNSEIQNLGSFLNSDIIADGTIPEKMGQYFKLFEREGVMEMTLPSLQDTSGFINDPTDTPDQMALDAFVIGVSGYMACLKFLLEDRVYSELPFSFTLPFYNVDEGVLNVNTFKYMCHPSTAIATHGQYYNSRVLMNQILRFCNEWSPLFDDGPKLDTNTAVIDTISGYCKLSMAEMSESQRDMVGIRDDMANIQSLLDSGEMMEDIKSEMNGIKEEVKNEMRGELDNISGDIEGRVNRLFEEKLENFREEIKDIFFEETRKALEETREALEEVRKELKELKELEEKVIVKQKESKRKTKRDRRLLYK